MDALYKIRLATEQDLVSVYEMAFELAKMQDLLERFCLTEESLQQMINDPAQSTVTIVAEQADKVCGFAMYTLLKNNRLYHHGFAMYIDELYVQPAYRNGGMGLSLFKYIAQEAISRNCNRLEWWVTTTNHAAIAFYERLGARSLDEFITFRFQQPAIDAFLAKG